MRQVGARPVLPVSTLAKLAVETVKIQAAADVNAEALVRYGLARRAAWFRIPLRALMGLSGSGQRCMSCSGGESSEVEHYRPKSTYPELALAWTNMLWICGVCNRYKGDLFEEPCLPINPIDDDVWSLFFIDEFGNLSPRWNVAQNCLEARAIRTVELFGLDRQALQEAREHRLRDLREKVADAMAQFRIGLLDKEQLEERALLWYEQPFQPDVADYFFAGPGRHDVTEPFSAFIDVLDS